MSQPCRYQQLQHRVKQHQITRSVPNNSSIVTAHRSIGNPRIPAVKEPIDRYCFEPYILFDGSTCRTAIELMTKLEESAPCDPRVLRPLIAGMKSLSSTAHGALRPYYAEDLRERLERLISVEGHSTDVLFDYAAVLEGERQIEVLESIIASDPSAAAEVYIALGRALINAHRIESGLEAFRTAFESASGKSKEFHGAELVQALRVYGSPQDKAEADRIEQRLRDLE